MSEIVEFYRDKTIFITGGTGFIGQIIIEKLLRCCDVREIYLLIRGKKGKSWQSRVQEMLSDPIFERLNREKPSAVEKLKGIVGDCSLPSLGINDFDRDLLINNVEIVIHGAATVKFDEDLAVAMQINVAGTEFLIELSKQMTHLVTFVYVSTAYSNCNRFNIDERIYEPPITREKVQHYMSCVNEKSLHVVQTAILSGFPNTYALTKCLAEHLVAESSRDLPIVIFRPAIVMPTANEPVPGWINNFYGPMGIIYGVSLGVLHTFYADITQKAQLVPVDYCVNALLASAWDRPTRRNITPIYNFVPSTENIPSWEQMLNIIFKVGIENPPIRTFGHSDFVVTPNKIYAKILHFFYHLLPAMILDTILKCIGHKFRLMRVYAKVEKLNDVLNYFSFNPFVFEDKQSEVLWHKLSDNDKKLFRFNMKELDWDKYMVDMYFGLRKFMLKDDPSTIPAAIKRQKKIDAIWRVFKWFMLTLVLFTIYMFIKKLFA